MDHESDDYTNYNWCSWHSHERISKKTEGLGNKRTVGDCWRTRGDHPNYYIIGNGQNNEKSPGSLRRLAVTQTPVKGHQLTLIWKPLMREEEEEEDLLQHPVTASVTKTYKKKQEKLANKNRKKNNCIDSSSDKLTKWHTRKSGQSCERVTAREKMNIS